MNIAVSSRKHEYTRLRNGQVQQTPQSPVGFGNNLTIILSGTPDRIRTCNHLVRSQVLYPVELRVQ